MTAPRVQSPKQRMRSRVTASWRSAMRRSRVFASSSLPRPAQEGRSLPKRRLTHTTRAVGRRSSLPGVISMEGGDHDAGWSVFAKVERPAGVRRQTIQSGFKGLLNQGSAQPRSTQLLTVRSPTRRPFLSNSGNFPPGCVRPLSNQRRCDGVGRADDTGSLSFAGTADNAVHSRVTRQPSLFPMSQCDNYPNRDFCRCQPNTSTV